MPFKIASLEETRSEGKKPLLYPFDLAVFEFERLYFVFASVLACFPPVVVFVLSVVLNRKRLSYYLFGCVPLGESGSGSVIQYHSDLGASKEVLNLWSEWIHRFL